MSEERDTEAEHAALLEAAIGRDLDRACDLMADHVRLTAQALIDAVRAGRASESGVGQASRPDGPATAKT